MNVSLIIPTCNKLPRLKLTLASIRSQNYPKENYEVIIIDDGSTDGTYTFLKHAQYPFNLKLIQQTNQGRACARNKGIKAAQFELILFIDDDVILDPLFITAHVDFQKRHSSIVHGVIYNLSYVKFFKDPSQGIFYPEFQRNKVESALRTKCITEEDIITNFYKKIGSNNKMNVLESTLRDIFAQQLTQGYWLAFTGGNVSLKKSWLEEVDGFDEHFGTIWGGEDIELGYRLHIKGYPFIYSKEAANYHILHYRADFENELKKSVEYFYQKHKCQAIRLFYKLISGKINRECFIKRIEHGKS